MTTLLPFVLPMCPGVNHTQCYTNTILSLLYGCHFGITISLLHNVTSSNNSSIHIGDWLLFVSLILPFIISYLVSMIVIIYDLYDLYNDNIGEMNPIYHFN